MTWEYGEYNQIMYSGVQSRVVLGWHKAMEKPFSDDCYFPRTLEVGAGEGQHFPFVKHAFDDYVMVDRRYPSSGLLNSSKVRVVIGDAHRLPCAEESIDRLISTCVLHHLDSPESALNDWRRAVRVGGQLTIFLSTDPGLVTRLGRKLTTGRKARKLRIDWDLTMAREHRNHVGALVVQLRHVFRNDKVSYLGLPFPWRTWNLNHGLIFRITKTGS
jgi:ubiquinone/menaquinone biosynthesis C-methylase UbiE